MVFKKTFQGGVLTIYFYKTISFSFHFAHYAILQQNNEKYPFTYWLNGRWFFQIIDRDSHNVYPIYPLLLCSDVCISNVGGGSAFLAFYAFPTFLETKFWE